MKTLKGKVMRSVGWKLFITTQQAIFGEDGPCLDMQEKYVLNTRVSGRDQEVYTSSKAKAKVRLRLRYRLNTMVMLSLG